MKVKNLMGFMLGNERFSHIVENAWTNADDCRVWICPDKIFIDRVVARYTPSELTQEQLLARARYMQQDMMNLISGLDRENVK